MPNPKNYDAIQINGNIDFENVGNKGPKDKITPITYSDKADLKLLENVGHHSYGFKIGKYIGSLFPPVYDLNDRKYYIKISLTVSGKPLISENNWVSLPCPDFCIGGNDE